jgi:hypothetical protein
MVGLEMTRVDLMKRVVASDLKKNLLVERTD